MPFDDHLLADPSTYVPFRFMDFHPVDTPYVVQQYSKMYNRLWLRWADPATDSRLLQSPTHSPTEIVWKCPYPVQPRNQLPKKGDVCYVTECMRLTLEFRKGKKKKWRDEYGRGCHTLELVFSQPGMVVYLQRAVMEHHNNTNTVSDV